MTLYLVRHAHAGARSSWDGPDVDRPLSEKGRHQTDALTAHLDGVGLDRVLSSASVRCQQTVAPMARSRGLTVEVLPALAEGAAPEDTDRLIWELASGGVDAVLASHGDVIPAVLDALRRDGVPVEEGHGLPKATYCELAVDPGGYVTGATFVDPRP